MDGLSESLHDRQGVTDAMCKMEKTGMLCSHCHSSLLVEKLNAETERKKE